MMNYTPRALRFARAILLVAVAAILTLVLQRWVGNTTIYRDELASKRAEMHAAILNNEPPVGSPGIKSAQTGPTCGCSRFTSRNWSAGRPRYRSRRLISS